MMLKKFYRLPVILLALCVASSSSPVFAQYDSQIDENLMISDGMDNSKITLELKGVDILDVLKVLSKKSGLNIVAGKNVRGQVTLFLQNVDVWDALKIILETSELAYELKGNIVKVITKADYEALYGRPYEDKRVTELIRLKYAQVAGLSKIINQLKSNVGRVIIDESTNSMIIRDTPDVLSQIRAALKEIDVPMQTEVYDLKYADSEELQKSIEEILTENVGAVRVDKRTNKIIVTDIPAKHTEIKALIGAFDAKPMQVLIEAKIIEVVLNDEYGLGINWKAVGNWASERGVDFESKGLSLSSLANDKSNLSTFTINSSSDDFYAVISALQSMGKTNTLSNPRVSVLNNEEAKIAVATRQPFVSQTVVQGDSTSTTADNVEFVDVGVTLKVTPTITHDGFILMEVQPSVSTAPDSLVIQGASDGTVFDRTVIPIVTKQEVETKVIIETGRTLVLGGLIQDSQTATVKKVPVLGDIPILGSAFKSKQDNFRKTELVLFLTPRIIRTEHDDSKKYDRFFEEDGALKDFNQVGGKNAEFNVASSDSRPYFQTEQASFWEGTREFYRDRDAEKAKKIALAKEAEMVDIKQKKSSERKRPLAESVAKSAAKTTKQEKVSQEKESSKKSPKKESIEKVNKKVVPKKAEPVKPVTMTKYDREARAYSEIIQKQVISVLKKSRLLRKINGIVNISLVLEKDGLLRNLDISCPEAPDAEMDMLLTVNRYAPYAPIPSSLDEDSVVVSFKIES